MKYITFAIPSYNSQEYLRNAVDSILSGGDEVEILIVNDGSTDKTSEIAHEYEKEYPHIVKAIDQENGGHGEAVNTGLSHAQGKYFKVVDSDDWVDAEALHKILDVLRQMEKEEQQIDMLIANYVYEKAGARRKKVISYENVLPVETVFGWDEVGKFNKAQYILMHSVIYRTELLKVCQLKLPKHTFYVDNIYVFYPLPYVTTMYYMNVDFYRYFIGREDQSVNEKNMIRRVDQQLYVNRTMIDMYDLKQIPNKKLREYMINYLAIMMTISSIILIRSRKPEALTKKKELWQYLKLKNRGVYRKIRYGILGQTINLPGRPGRRVSVMAYRLARRMIGFN